MLNDRFNRYFYNKYSNEDFDKLVGKKVKIRFWEFGTVFEGLVRKNNQKHKQDAPYTIITDKSKYYGDCDFWPQAVCFLEEPE